MATFILTWSPIRYPWQEHGYLEAIRDTAAGQAVRDSWSTGVRTHGIAQSDHAFVLRQHSERGIVAGGTFDSAIYLDRHWDGSGRQARFADVLFDVVLEPDDRLPVEVLEREIPDFPWSRLQGSGVQLPDLSAERLERLWTNHLSQLGLPNQGVGWRSPEEERVELFAEGALARVEVNRYERDPRVRRACIGRWGLRCTVCDLGFREVYGELGDGFIHVHHLSPLSAKAEGYVVNPIEDLRPVCPNCHAMLHRQSPPMTIEGLRAVLLAANSSV